MNAETIMHRSDDAPPVTIRRTDDPLHPFLIRLARGLHMLVTEDELAHIVVQGSAALDPVRAGSWEEEQ
jgi:hypothetical protein